MAQAPDHELPGQVHAILGPTNTGKTHLAIDRMLAHPDGMIGLPLRLLAREVYDRVCTRTNPDHVALVTGEERLVPPGSRYWICTVEAMPIDRAVDFLAVDEVQLAADRERGHVFTDRLLHARGRRETVFLGADTIKPLLLRLVPGARVETRPRLSALTYLGPRKLSRLPRRTAVIAYRAEDVYALAEFLRRQKGGAAVVMGALSPRTRNAQVAMFEAGEVDYLVATDAIGMGLNLSIEHVAFASLQKFDGALTRRLGSAEIGQVAGRAGRYLNAGTFGTTGDAPLLDEDTIAAVEDHRYRTLRRLRYRNSRLDHSSVPGLLTSLEAAPRHDFLIGAPEADDMKALRQLYKEEDIARAVRSPGNVPTLWRVCSIPDFQQMLHESHVGLLGHVFRYLVDGGKLPDDFLARQINVLDRTGGDMDTLQNRLAHIRTWTYVAHQADWLDDAAHWQGRARSVEERLSDALHQRLTQRFVDRHHVATLRRLKEAGDLEIAVESDGTVCVNDAAVGIVNGLRFERTSALPQSAEKAVRNELADALSARTQQILKSAGHDFRLRDGGIEWRNATIARLAKGISASRPNVRLLVDHETVDASTRASLLSHLSRWLAGYIAKELGPLIAVSKMQIGPAGRGLVYRLHEKMDAITCGDAGELIRTLSSDDKTRLKKSGVRFGRQFIYLPAILKPRRLALIAELRRAFIGDATITTVPNGRVSIPCGAGEAPPGFHRIGARWVRIDAIERLAEALAAISGPVTPTAELSSIVGSPRGEFPAVLKFLGYRRVPEDTDRFVLPARSQRPPKRRSRRVVAKDPRFAALETLRTSAGS